MGATMVEGHSKVGQIVFFSVLVYAESLVVNGGRVVTHGRRGLNADPGVVDARDARLNITLVTRRHGTASVNSKQ